jgi:general secretion pathway protein D
VEYKDVGLKLTFIPIIHLNNEVTIELNFEISQLGEPVGGDVFTPAVNRRNLNTFIMLKDGESRLLGGLIQDEARKTSKYSPFLGDLPVVGRFFRDEREEKVRRDVIISLTLRMVKRLEPPRPEVATFSAGTGQSFEGGPLAPVSAPAPPPPPSPARPGMGQP